jgi:hypothetical protein
MLLKTGGGVQFLTTLLPPPPGPLANYSALISFFIVLT